MRRGGKWKVKFSTHSGLRRQNREEIVSDVRDFRELRVPRNILAGLHNAGYSVPTPVQARSYAPILEGRSVVVLAKNGTGKTAAYLIPLLVSIDPALDETQALVILPTRELALQTYHLAKKIAAETQIKIGMVAGGIPLQRERESLLNDYHLLISTGGRLIDHIVQGYVDASSIRSVVIDEADEMLSFSRVNDIRADTLEVVERIIEASGRKPQYMLFSATMSGDGLKRFIEDYVDSPMFIKLREAKKDGILPTGIKHYVIRGMKRDEALREIFERTAIKQCIILCNSINSVEHVYDLLRDYDIEASYIHGQMDQKERFRVYKDFKRERTRVLVANSILYRGASFEAVNIVINYEIPRDPQDYVHRSGRTGRYGQIGITINIVSSKRDEEWIRRLESYLNIKFEDTDGDIDRELYDV